jgi:branched-chain amino acid aminotransferase
LGDGLFETIRFRHGRADRLDRHLARLRAGAGLLALPVPADDAMLETAIAALVAANGLGETALAQARITLTRGPAPRGVLPPDRPLPTLLVTAGPAAEPGPARVVVAGVTRRNELSPLSRVKSLNYLDNILARQEAAGRGADDALLLNTAGRIAESTIANLFLLLDGVLATPPVADGALPGIMRELVIERTGAVERPIGPQDLARAEALFLSSSLGLRAVVELDGAACGGEAAALVARVAAACR